MHTPRPVTDVMTFEEIDRSQVAMVGGKGAHLAELARIDGVVVPAGFCVTTAGFRRLMAEASSLDDRLDRLSRLSPDDREAVRTVSAEVREIIDGVTIPDDLAAAITGAVSRLGAEVACAVRSSATAEDLPTASFAGQHDTYLNVVGPTAVLRHVSRCWASLFTERAVTYRLRHGFDHRQVGMAVVVQRMVVPDTAGVMFTADPVTSNRKVVTIEATYGLGEALVDGLLSPDVYRVRDGELVDVRIATKRLAVRPAPGGGTRPETVDPELQDRPSLTDAHAVRLARLGRRIEAHFGSPQDIEWCLADGQLQVVQSRPITTLFPVPVGDDGANHVYVSVGHQQMMTDPMKPLGLSLFQLTALRPMQAAGGRLFVDVTLALASPASRASLLDALRRSDPLIGDALQTILDRGDFIPSLPAGAEGDLPIGGPPASIETDPAIVEELIGRTQASIVDLRREIASKRGVALLDFILADVAELKRILLDPLSMQAIMAGMEATWWINDHLREWLGETNAADTLTRSVPGNVTSEMGLALLDVADVIRPHPEVVAFLQHVEDDGFLDELPTIEGGRSGRDAIVAFLDRYGMRCVGEIDITRPRWAERPSTLVPVILGNVTNFQTGAHQRRVEQGRREARDKELELLRRLRSLPDGDPKADETKRMIERLRTFIGYREHPKYGIISRYFVYKQALMAEADRLVQAGVLGEAADVFFLTMQELQDVVRTRRLDPELIRQREAEYRSFQALVPPRVLTSDGEVVAGAYRRDEVPDGALVGLAVSGGVVEGRARVVLDMAQADVGPGDILVTAHTDPSWSPLFVAVGGLVTEVGGLMTHGAVIAREYGLPAVVGVENATRLIHDGQRIRVNGTHGYVEILPAPRDGDGSANGAPGAQDDIVDVV